MATRFRLRARGGRSAVRPKVAGCGSSRSAPSWLAVAVAAAASLFAPELFAVDGPRRAVSVAAVSYAVERNGGLESPAAASPRHPATDEPARAAGATASEPTEQSLPPRGGTVVSGWYATVPEAAKDAVEEVKRRVAAHLRARGVEAETAAIPDELICHGPIDGLLADTRPTFRGQVVHGVTVERQQRDLGGVEATMCRVRIEYVISDALLSEAETAVRRSRRQEDGVWWANVTVAVLLVCGGLFAALGLVGQRFRPEPANGG